MTDPQPIQIHISPTLSSYTVPLATFKSSRPAYQVFAVGTFIFSPSHNRLLLVQRASTERGFPNKWEIPGGGTEDSDPTILHSAAREAFEETGLHLTKLVREVEKGVEWGDGMKRWLKLSFEIEVAEMEGVGEGEEEGVGVCLNPEEHQGYVWATEEDIRVGKYDIVTPEQQALMLEAFKSAKGDGKSNTGTADGLADG